MRYVDQPRDSNARGDVGDAPSTFDVYVVKSEVSSREGERWEGYTVSDAVGLKEKVKKINTDALCLVITTNEIVHDIGVSDTFCDLFLVADVPFLPK